MRQMAVAAVATVLLLTACGVGDGDSEQSQDDPGGETTSASTTSPTTTTPSPAPTEDPLLQMGDTVNFEGNGTGGSTQVLAVKDPAPPGMGDTPSPGTKFVSLRLRQCMAADAQQFTTTYVGEWHFLDRRGGEYSSIRTMLGWPTPEFPQFIQLTSGDCKEGWIAFELKKSVDYDSVAYRLVTGQTLGEWSLDSR